MLTSRPLPFRETAIGQALMGVAGLFGLGATFAAAGPAPFLIIMALALLAPSVLVLGFVCFSYFRIHEAYPFLVAFKLPFVFSAAAFAVIAFGIATHLYRSPKGGAAWFAPAVLTTGLAASLLLIIDSFPDGAGREIAMLTGLTLAAIAFYCWFRLVEAMNGQPWALEMRLYIGFVVVVTIGVAFAVNRGVAFTYWSDIFWKMVVMTLALAWLVRTRRDFTAALWLLVASGALIALRTIYNWYLEIDLVEGSRVTIGRTLFSTAADIENALPGRPIPGGSLLGDPNDLALVLLFPVGLALAVLVRLPWRHPLALLSLVSLPLLITAIVMTQSRGGALGLLAVAGLIGLYYLRSKAVLIAGCAVVALGLAVAMDIGGRKSGGIAELEARGGLDRSASERLYAWKAALNMTMARPVRGVGVKNFPGQFRDYSPVWVGRQMDVHSTWLGVLAETGLPGFALFIGIIAALARSLLRALRRLDDLAADPVTRAFALGLLAGLAGFCVSGTFLTQGFTWPIYLQLGFSAALTGYVSRLAAERTIAPVSAPRGATRSSPGHVSGTAHAGGAS